MELSAEVQDYAASVVEMETARPFSPVVLARLRALGYVEDAADT